MVLYEFQYPDIESIFLDPSDSFLTINLMRHHNDNGTQKCFVFETTQKSEIGSLIISYYPSLASWITESETAVRKVDFEMLYFVFLVYINGERYELGGGGVQKISSSLRITFLAVMGSKT